MWTRALIIFVIAGGATDAHAHCRGYQDQADDESSDLPCKEPYARWSLVPEVAALAGWDPEGRPHSVLGAELRLRYNRPWHDPSRLYTLGLGVESFGVATVEPYLAVGLGKLTRWCPFCSERAALFGGAHVALGAGVAWSDERRGEPFVLARITLGLVYARPSGEYLDYIYPHDSARGGQLGRATRFKLSSQVDIVIETVIAADGEWRFAMGMALDPFRIIQDQIALLDP